MSTSGLFLEEPQLDPNKAAVHILPVPLEATVSYGGGTKEGPRAILDASYQLELYDREFQCEPGVLYGIHTYPEMEFPESESDAENIERIAERVSELYLENVLLGVLGGEHSLTFGVVQGVLNNLEGPLTVVQIDAHSDLRDSYEDTPHSHACVGRRLLELPRVEQLLQLGIRSLCTEEADVLDREARVKAWFTEEIHEDRFEAELRERIRGKQVYLTIDVDGFDPSLIPCTGTPEPWGLTYPQGERILRIICEEAKLVAFDCVELAPVPGHHASEFVVAKLLYRLMNLAQAPLVHRLRDEIPS